MTNDGTGDSLPCRRRGGIIARRLTMSQVLNLPVGLSQRISNDGMGVGVPIVWREMGIIRECGRRSGRRRIARWLLSVPLGLMRGGWVTLST